MVKPSGKDVDTICIENGIPALYAATARLRSRSPIAGKFPMIALLNSSGFSANAFMFCSGTFPISVVTFRGASGASMEMIFPVAGVSIGKCSRIDSTVDVPTASSQAVVLEAALTMPMQSAPRNRVTKIFFIIFYFWLSIFSQVISLVSISTPGQAQRPSHLSFLRIPPQ